MLRRVESGTKTAVSGRQSPSNATGGGIRWERRGDIVLVMEIVDDAVILAVPGAMDAGVTDPLCWGALALGLGIAWFAAFPVNRWLLARGLGHAKAMAHHGSH